MKIAARDLIKIIREEKKKILNEGCGCGGSSSPQEDYSGDMIDIRSLDGTMPQAIEDTSDWGDIDSMDTEAETMYPTTGREFLTKDDALKAVVAIAMSTMCPVTSETLLGAVRDLVQM